MHYKSYVPGFYSMRDLNDDSSSSSWPLFYGDKMVANGQCYNGFMPKTSFDGHLGHDKDSLKQKMLEHEAVFKNQVLELHRLYRIQRDMMEDFKRNELPRDRSSMEPSSSSSSLQRPPVPSEEARKWHKTVPFSDSSHCRTFVAGLENFSSPSSTKENPTQPGCLPFQNGSTTKNSEASDSRPLKVRKMLFDLQLPADEYVDPEEEENLLEYNKGVRVYSRNVDPTNGPESGTKFFLGTREGAKTDPLNDASTSAGLADLNEPIQIEEKTAPLSIDFLGHTSENGETKTMNQQAKSTTSYLSVAGEPLYVRGGISINSSIERQVNEKEWLSRVNGAGSSRGILSSSMQGCQPDKSPLSSHPGQGTFNPPGMYSSGYNREEKWREGFEHGLESFDRCKSHSNYGHLEPIASRAPGYPFFSSSSFSNSWFSSVSSWAQPSSSFTQNIPTLETPSNRVVGMSRHLQPSAQCRQSLEGNWHVDSSSKLARGLGSEPKSNRFYHAPSSRAKELQFQSLSAGFDRINCSRGDNMAFDRSTDHDFGNLPKGLYHADSRPAIDINLNEELPKSLGNENVILQDVNMADGKSKPEDNFPTLPWLKTKPLHVDEVTDTRRSELLRELSYRDASSNGLCIKSGTVRDLNQLYPSKLMLTSSESQIPREKEIAQPPTIKKILGFPIFERDASENELPSPASTSVNVNCCPEGRAIAGVEKKNGIIDINVPCEPDEQTAADEPNTDKNSQEKITHIKDQFDLNSCASDSEDPSPPSYERNGASVRITLEIDLEVPILMESEDDNTESKQKHLNEVSSQSFGNQNKEIQNEVFRDAAETLVSISLYPQVDMKDGVCLPCEASLGEALLWLADAVSSDSNETVNTTGNESRVIERSSQKELDDFEAMTLQLMETKAEDYMPKPFLPELQKVEDAGARPLHTRTRRGHARRGRQWRDFQRDILPGLASLSRHEMTEDLQIFGGMMRATGHTWNSGLTRRNGTRNVGARGRRRTMVEAVPAAIATPLIQQLSSIDGGLEDRSLTGWGKTTRRPRRQRCPAGNPPSVVLT